jgi:hypothetical protein
MTMFRPGFLVLAVLSLVLAGCSGPGLRGGIGVSAVDFRATAASLLESRGTLTLRFTNETIASLGYSRSSHKLYLNGRYVGKVVNDRPFGLPPLNAVTQEVTVQIENLALVRQLVSVRDSHSAAYRLESVLFQTINEDNYQIKVQSEGTLDLHSLAGDVK